MTDQNVDFESDVLANDELVVLLEDDEFCAELWTAFANITWFKRWDETMSDDEKCIAVLKEEHHARMFNASFRSMGGLIADLRNELYDKGEDYMSWYCSNAVVNSDYGFISDRVREALAKIGWYPVKDEYYYEANID
jgi:hypothetical protein